MRVASFFGMGVLCFALMASLTGCPSRAEGPGIVFGDAATASWPDGVYHTEQDQVLLGPACLSDDECVAWLPEWPPCARPACDREAQVCLLMHASDCCLNDGECDDGNSCTLDRCPAAGQACTHQDVCGCGVAADCEDGNPCTVDQCVDGQCNSWPVPLCCNSDGACQDGDDCTVDTCQAHQCHHAAQDNCCRTVADCAPAGLCQTVSCQNHVCQVRDVGECCLSDSQCDDGHACSADRCDLVSRQCRHEWFATCCETASDCNDGNPCTDDGCRNSACYHYERPDCCHSSADCEDGNPCTQDTCSANRCQSSLRPGCCSSDAQCNDGDVCTEDMCLSYGCTHVRLAQCCMNNADCQDSDPCTQDFCSAHQCWNAPIAGCCRQINDCNDADACTTDMCLNNRCQYAFVRGCCETDDPCADSDLCTVDQCVNHTCRHFYNPSLVGCCTPRTLLLQTFMSLPSNWGFTQTRPDVGFSLSNARADSPPYSLRLYNPATGTYANVEELSVAATATSAPLNLPADVAPTLSVQAYFDIEPNPEYDQFRIEVISSNGSTTTLWDKSSLSPSAYGFWQPITVALTAWRGQTIRIRFVFDSVDGYFNLGEGIYLDDLTVSQTCTSSLACVADADCHDGDSCTSDHCVQNRCRYEISPNCCEPETLWQADFQDGTAQGLDLQSSTGDERWQVMAGQSMSAPFALYFGDARTMRFAPAATAWGIAETAPLDLPDEMAAAFAGWVYLDVPRDGLQTRFRIFVIEGDLWSEVWSQNELSFWQYATWTNVMIDLSAWAGHTVRIAFTIDTAGISSDAGEGLYLDDLRVALPCR